MSTGGPEDTMPMLPPTHPESPDNPVVRYERRRRVDQQLVTLRRQVIFLFVLLVVSMVILSIYQQLTSNRIEYDRYDLCVQRQAEIAAYNAQNSGLVPPFPIASCGADPRTD